MSQNRVQTSLSRCILVLSLYLLLLLVVVFIALAVGSESVNIGQACRDLSDNNVSSIDVRIIFNQRLPRIVMALIAGGALALIGAVFQTILHNPLADPYTLGLAGSSSAGAVLALSLPSLSGMSIAGFGLVQIFSLLGAGMSAAFIYRLARRSGAMSVNTLLLAGVVIGIISSALVMLIRYLSSPHLLVSMDRWIMGGLDINRLGEVLPLLPLILPGLGVLFCQAVSLNHIVFGEELAAGLGVSVNSVQKWCFFGGSVTTAAIVSQTGPIAFVGLIVPHIVKKINGTDHRLLLPACFLAGGSFLILCDTLARTIAAPAEMPVGIITAAIGGVFFIALLVSRR